jgi:hypothetical protein
MKKACSVLLIVVLSGLLTCCGGDGKTGTSPAKILSGVAKTDGVHYSHARIVSNSGKLIGEVAIYKSGGFVFRSETVLPDNLAVMVDLVFGELNCTYAYEAKRSNAGQILYIGPVSTLMYKYHLMKPGKSLNTIRSEVLKFLSIKPEHSDYRISINPALFSIEQFMASAVGFGGFDAYIDFLVDELVSGKGPYFFGAISENPDEAIFEGLIGNLQKNLESQATNYAAGWVFNMIGGGNGGNPNAEIETLLRQQAILLSKMETQIISLGQALTNAVNTIEDKIDKSAYTTAVEVLTNQVAEIEAKSEQLAYYATLPPDVSNKEDIRNLSIQIKDRIPVAFTTIRDTLKGTAGAEGLLSLWSRINFKRPGDMPDYVSAISSQFSYYFGIQLHALNLMIEAYHAEDPSNIGMAKNYYNGWIQDLKDELALFESMNPVSELSASITLPAGSITSLSLGNTALYALGDKKNVFALDPETLELTGQFNSPGNNLSRAFTTDDTSLYYLQWPDGADFFTVTYYSLYRSRLSNLSAIDSKTSVAAAPYSLIAQLLAGDQRLLFLEGRTTSPDYYLEIFNKTTLEHITDIHIGTGTVCMALADKSHALIYVSSDDGNSYLKSLDISSLQFLDTLPIGIELVELQSILVKDTKAAIAGGEQEVWIVDISDLSVLKVLKKYALPPDFNAQRMTFTDKLLYVDGYMQSTQTPRTIVMYDNPFASGLMYKDNFGIDETFLFADPLIMYKDKYIYTIALNTVYKWQKRVVVDLSNY